MKVETAMVQRITITGVEHLDAISVYLEDCGPGRGKVTITCWDESWTNFWGSMGDGRTIRGFFIGCDNGYLCSKFAPGLHSTEEDADALTDYARKDIIKQRREAMTFKRGGMTKEEARELFDDAEYLGGYHTDAPESYGDLMYRIFGDEWWHGALPQKPNHRYEHLCRILDVVREALTQTETLAKPDAPLEEK